MWKIFSVAQVTELLAKKCALLDLIFMNNKRLLEGMKVSAALAAVTRRQSSGS